MSLSKNQHSAEDEHRILETTVLSRIPRKLNHLPPSQLVAVLQSATMGQNINLVPSIADGIATVGDWRYQSKITAFSLQRATSIFEQSNYYVGPEISHRAYSPTNKTYARIAELGADNQTYKYTIEWLQQLRIVVIANKMWWCEPLVNLGIDSEIVFEWWHKNKKLAVYILGNTAEYIKIWGPDIDNEMEDGLAASPAELTHLWKWLVS